MTGTPERLRRFRANKKRKEVYLDPDAFTLVSAFAEEHDMAFGAALVRLALAQLEGQMLPSAQEQAERLRLEEQLRELNMLVRKISDNVNQIARHSNRIEALRDEHGLLQHLKSCCDLMTESAHKVSRQ